MKSLHFQVNSACEGEDDGDELADEPVDEVYGSEDLPYNFRFLHSPDLKPLSTWRTHSGPRTRPIFFRPSHRVEPREIPISESEDEKDSSSCADGSEHEEEQSDGSKFGLNRTGTDRLWCLILEGLRREISIYLFLHNRVYLSFLFSFFFCHSISLWCRTF